MMGTLGEIKKFIESRRRCAPNRKNYGIEFAYVTETAFDYVTIIPTIIYTPWIHRYNDSYVVEITWLVFHVGFFKWFRREDSE